MRLLRKWLARVLWLTACTVVLAGVCIYFYAKHDIVFAPQNVTYDLKSGSTLRTVSRELASMGIVKHALMFEMLGRLRGDAPHIKTGNYELNSPTSPLQLIRKFTLGDVTQAAIRFREGWTFKQVRLALDAHDGITHETRDLANEAIATLLGIPDAKPEGWIFPDTYHFSRGASDLAVLRRAHALMQKHLAANWSKRAEGVPLASPYEALILASIVEKETGKAADRPLVSSVFVNRLRMGMRLQTDPTVIYGMGDGYAGPLRRRDLQADTPWNTYTRAGLPPTPIAMPSLPAIQAALNPATSDRLYFVARGDGSSQFSSTLDEHNAAVNRYIRSKHAKTSSP